MPELSEMQKDELQELGNVGAGKASRFLADKIGEKVDIGIPDVQVITLTDAQEAEQVFEVSPTDQLTAVFMPLNSPGGGVVVSFTQQEYPKFLQLYSDGDEGQDNFLEAAKKVSNFYLDAMAQILGKEIEDGQPRLISLPLNTMMIQVSSGLGGEGGQNSQALVINTDFNVENVEGEITLFLELEDVEEVLEAMESNL